MTYDIMNEWDEDLYTRTSVDEDAEESVLRDERDRVLSNLNHGIKYEVFNPDQLA